MRTSLLALAVILSVSLAAAGSRGGTAARVLLDNAVVRVLSSGDAELGHEGAVVVFFGDAPGHHAGDAAWTSDAAGAWDKAGAQPAVIVVPKSFASTSIPAGQTASQPGQATFTGMSFHTIFDNDRVAAIRARMDVGATEAFHTHASDTVVVHLTGGSIEDTADGVTKVNRWKKGDIEFESRGSSHSARNVGGAIEVVLVTLKPKAAAR